MSVGLPEAGTLCGFRMRSAALPMIASSFDARKPKAALSTRPDSWTRRTIFAGSAGARWRQDIGTKQQWGDESSRSAGPLASRVVLTPPGDPARLSEQTAGDLSAAVIKTGRGTIAPAVRATTKANGVNLRKRSVSQKPALRPDHKRRLPAPARVKR